MYNEDDKIVPNKINLDIIILQKVNMIIILIFINKLATNFAC